MSRTTRCYFRNGKPVKGLRQKDCGRCTGCRLIKQERRDTVKRARRVRDDGEDFLRNR